MIMMLARELMMIPFSLLLVMDLCSSMMLLCSKCACLSRRSLVLSWVLISESQESCFPGEVCVKVVMVSFSLLVRIAFTFYDLVGWPC